MRCRIARNEVKVSRMESRVAKQKQAPILE